MASLIVRRRSITELLKPYYSSSSCACLFSHTSRNPTNRELSHNPTIPSPASIDLRAAFNPIRRTLYFGAGGAIMKSRFSSTPEDKYKKDCLALVEPQSPDGKLPSITPRAILKLRESESEHDPDKYKMIQGIKKSIYTKNKVRARGPGPGRARRFGLGILLEPWFSIDSSRRRLVLLARPSGPSCLRDERQSEVIQLRQVGGS